MIYLAVVIGIVLISVLVMPFFVGEGGLLQAGASINSKEKLASLKEALLKRYLEDEKTMSGSGMAKMAWQQRKTFLTNRYIDASRRLDFLEHGHKEGNP